MWRLTVALNRKFTEVKANQNREMSHNDIIADVSVDADMHPVYIQAPKGFSFYVD